MGAAIAFVDERDRVLLLQRSKAVDNAGLWSLPGGHAERGERPWQTAVRETREETGFDARGLPVEDHRTYHSSYYPLRTYHVFVVSVDSFKPRLDHESVGWKWVHLDDVPKLNLHPPIYGVL